jgi:hypothetical protein
VDNGFSKVPGDGDVGATTFFPRETKVLSSLSKKVV